MVAQKSPIKYLLSVTVYSLPSDYTVIKLLNQNDYFNLQKISQ